MIALRNREAITSQQRARIARNLDVFDRYLDERGDDFRWNRPRAGSVGFLRIEGVEDTFSLCETLVQDAGVMLVPSRLFDYGDSHVRIGFGREDFPVVLRHFAEHWQRR
jgi:aspartate/methionine/tyrosine aminotransferase